MRRSQYSSVASNYPINIISRFQTPVVVLLIVWVILASVGCTAPKEVVKPDARPENVEHPSALQSDNDNQETPEGALIDEKSKTNADEIKQGNTVEDESSLVHDGSPLELPDEVQAQILQAVTMDLGQSAVDVTIDSATPETWSNGCLDLARPDEFCAMALVDGWQVQVTYNQDTLTYHTDSTGTIVRRVP
ncbi:MAG: hypothetical protein F6K09_30385 [Merismopedia sp. SIO2A8]|nr:hypothetical protein [Merismopedia sp. SIO2A8]